MRIAFYSDNEKRFNPTTLLTDPVAGTQSSLIWVADALAALGHEVFVLNRSEPGVYRGVSYRHVQNHAHARQTIVELGALDVVVAVANGVELLLGDRMPSVRKTIYWLHNPELTHACHRAIEEGLIDQVLCVSEFHQDLFIRYAIYPKVTFIHNGVNPEFFPESLLDLPKEDRVLFVGSICKEKGVHHLLRVMPMVRGRFPELSLAIAGSYSLYYDSFERGGLGLADRSYEEEYLRPLMMDRTGRMHDYIELLGALPPPRLAVEMARSRLVVVNPNWEGSLETCCNAALEAQCAATPVLGVNRGALPETILGGSTGHIVTKRGDTALAEAICHALASPEEEARLGWNGRARILAEFTYRRIGEKWERLLSDLLENRPIKKRSLLVRRGRSRLLTLSALRSAGFGL